MLASIVFPIDLDSNHPSSCANLFKQKGIDKFEVIFATKAGGREVIDSFIDRTGCKNDLCRRIVTVEVTAAGNRIELINAGVRAAGGDVIIITSPDVAVKDNFISEHMRYHHQFDPALVIAPVYSTAGDTEWENSAGEPGSENETSFEPNIYYWDHYAAQSVIRFSCNPGALKKSWLLGDLRNLSFQRGLFGKAGGFEESYTDVRMAGIDFAYRAVNAGAITAINNRAGVFLKTKEGKSASNLFFHELDRFSEKYPEKNVRDLLHGVNPGPDNQSGTVKTIVFGDPGQLEKVKEIIEREAAGNDIQVILIDCNEATDIDIWLRKQDYKLPPRYYPASNINITFLTLYIQYRGWESVKI